MLTFEKVLEILQTIWPQIRPSKFISAVMDV